MKGEIIDDFHTGGSGLHTLESLLVKYIALMLA